MQTFGTHPLFWALIAFIYLYLINAIVVSQFVQSSRLLKVVVIVIAILTFINVATFSFRPAFSLLVVSFSLGISVFADLLVMTITKVDFSEKKVIAKLQNIPLLFAVVTCLVAFMLTFDTLFPPVSLAKQIGAMI